MKKTTIYSTLLLLGIVIFVAANIYSSANKHVEKVQQNIELTTENVEIKEEVVHLKEENTQLKISVNELQTKLADTLVPPPAAAAPIIVADEPEQYVIFSAE